MAFVRDFSAENTKVVVTIYPQTGDPVFDQRPTTPIVIDGASATDGGSVIACTTNKTIAPNSFAGSFNIDFKPGNDTNRDWLSLIVDDDWIDIEFIRNGVSYYTMAGMIDGIRENTSVTKAGTTASIFSIHGRDLGKILDDTEIWFTKFPSNFLGIMPLAVLEVLGGFPVGTPQDIVLKYINGFLKPRDGTANLWRIPNSYHTNPGGNAVSLLTDPTFFDSKMQGTTLSQAPANVNNENLGPLITKWSNPILNEIFYDLTPFFKYNTNIDVRNSNFEPNKFGIDYFVPRVVMREKPFPYARNDSDPLDTQDRQLDKSPFFKTIGKVILSEKDINNKNVGRGGYERKNVHLLEGFEVSDLMGLPSANFFGLYADTDSIAVHGVRKLQEKTEFLQVKTLFNSTETISQNYWNSLVRSWYAMNPYLLNGTLSFRRGVPELRVGYNLNIVGANNKLKEQYYVQGVTHTFSAPNKMRTTAQVVRGWRGDVGSYTQALLGSIENSEKSLAAKKA